ncbi:uncharacterized protein LOC9640051 [Selaginella moellendorffii]|uniref:uncharacterized protein LOC9640051 n=1 Tax=Selaginella moellendorffii TaxID=88036 RepID=UPI000D1CAD10|nr:uncharacterized protein LOC9640051 [Selaginella moellendorffii]|eukprot:XP_024532363.1 uncharacterized protein LOC9640051 [Selaginella moellendorffii]
MEQLLLQLDVPHWRDALVSYKTRRGPVADFRGEIMELLIHLTFPKFLADCEQILPRTMPARAPGNVQKLVVDEQEDLHVYFYSSFEDLEVKIKDCLDKGAKAAYFWPRLQTDAVVDSVFIDFKRQVTFLLQATVAKTCRTVVWHPVHKLVGFLRQNSIGVAGLYFVTSETSYTHFGYQTWKKVRGVHQDELILPDLPQYKVKFKMLESDMENLEKLQEYRDGIDEILKLMAKFGNDMPECCVRTTDTDVETTPTACVTPYAWSDPLEKLGGDDRFLQGSDLC